MSNSTFGTIRSLGLAAMPGTGGKALSFPAAAPHTGGYLIRPGVSGSVTTFTLVYDLLIPAGQSSGYGALFQTDLSNRSDADLFLKRLSADSAGIGISGTYDGEVSLGGWHRIAFTFEGQGDGSSVLSKYVDGALVGQQSVSTSRFSFDGDSGFLILTDEDGETWAGALSSFLFTTTALSEQQVAALGGTTAGGILAAAPAEGSATQFDFESGTLAASFGPGTMAAVDAAQAGGIASPAELGLPAYPADPAGVLHYPASDIAQGYTVTTGATETVSSFTLIYDLYLSAKDLGGYAALFQTDPGNASDADLFLKKLGTGIAGIGISSVYEGEITLDAWHRIAVSYQDMGNGNTVLRKYVDGALVGEQTLSTSRFSIDASGRFLILADEDGETAAGFLNSFAYVGHTLTGAEIAALGGATRGGIFTDATVPAGTLQFDFDKGGYGTTYGTGTLAPRGTDGGSIGDADKLGVGKFPGDDSGVLGFPATGPGEGYQIGVNVPGSISSYSVLFDLLIPAGQDGDAGALFRTSADMDANANVFLVRNQDGSIGISVAGETHGSFAFGQWHRLAITVQDQGNGSSVLTAYVDGAVAGHFTVDAAKFSVNGTTGCTVLSDNDGETWAGYLNSLHITPAVLDGAAIAALGGPTIGGIIAQANANPYATQFDFDNGTLTASYGSATMTAIGMLTPPAIAQAIDDQRLTTATGTITIDLAGVFSGGDLTYNVTTGDGKIATARVVDGKLVVDVNGWGITDITVTASNAAGDAVSDSFRLRHVSASAYTVAVVPDTQDYTDDPAGARLYHKMTQWLADNKAALNTVFALQVGDVTQWSAPEQWAIAKDAWSTLNGVVPYAVLPGNHDLAEGSASNHTTLLGQYFTLDYMTQNSTLGGVYDGEPNSTANAWYTFEGSDGTKWMVLMMEFGPRDDVVRWAKGVMDAHLDYKVILATHHYTNMGTRADPLSNELYGEGTGKDYGMVNDPQGASDGEDLWQTLVSQYSNISFVFSGHVFGDGAETIVSYNQFGQPVYQMFVNYQDGVASEITGNGDASAGGNGGNGAMRLVTIDPETGTVYTETYLANLDTYLTGVRQTTTPSRDGTSTADLTGPYLDHEQTIPGFDTDAPDYQFKAKAGDDLTLDAGNAGTIKVTLDGSASIDLLSQVAKYEWLNAAGEVIATGKNAALELAAGKYSFTLRAVTADGVTSTDTVDVTVTGAATLLRDNFNDGNANGWTRTGGTWLVKGTAAATPTAANAQGALYAYNDSSGAMIWSDPAAKAWTGYTLDVTLITEDDDTIGVYFYYTDANNFYRLTFNIQNNERLLVKVKDGVSTTLARETITTPFDQTMDLKVSVADGRIFATLDGDALFGGAVTDATAPLTGGTVGLVSNSQHQSIFDDVLVTAGTLRAYAGRDIRVIDSDGDGAATISLTGSHSFALGGIAGATWSENGKVVANAADAEISLGAGTHVLTLNLTGAGDSGHDSDSVIVTVIKASDVLVQDDFADGNANGWRFVDEHELGAAPDWQVVNGRLTQLADSYSRQLGGSGDTAPTPEWRLTWSPLGDGIYALRKGAYALWDEAGAREWRNYSTEATIRWADTGGVGFLFHYTDANNTYKLELDSETGLIQLFSLKGGIEQTLWQSPNAFTATDTAVLRVDIVEGVITAWLDGVALFASPIAVHDTEQGTVGLYTWGNPGVSFDDVLVTRLNGATVPGQEITGTAASEMLTSGAGDDVIRGLGGNDTLVGGGGNDTLDGGAGADVAVVNATRAGSTLTRLGDGSWRLTSADGTDVLRSIEVVRFTDGDLALHTAPGDFLGTATTDLLFQHGGGTVALWSVANGAVTASSGLGTLPAGATVLASGDLTGDGIADILTQRADGSLAVWETHGGTVTTQHALAAPGAGRQVAAIGDVDGNGAQDIVLQGSDGAITALRMQGGTVAGVTTLGHTDAAWTLRAATDLDGDGTDDLVFTSTGGDVAAWMVRDGVAVSGKGIGHLADGWSFEAAGDVTGDGTPDLVFAHTSGTMAYWALQDGGVTATGAIGQYAEGWSFATAGDLDADGTTDLVFTHASGAVAAWQVQHGLAVSATSLGATAPNWQLV
ncbi:Metallophos domain-containing protein [Rhodovastum atsumiense]|uniref:Uncharacterized protein n=1 Tax=Rhodovastum atsumiense TaxID=504468 RepID=A0A5M6IRY1_9PROT|nr:FG-GAP-like repeat-containing protein [Rhodovastum atsumiense]KAA5610669.1 hypothetical protein F1189_18005 [Rhodovastum atsumiense]CAH2603337.1 Metallophos domain-containing protein [Rhodovastum atsumiense]